MAQTPEELMGDKVLDAADKADFVAVGKTLQTALNSNLDIVAVVAGRNLYDETALHVTARNPKDDTAVAELLIRWQADVNARNYLGQTPLHVAAMSGNIKMSQLLIETGADVRAVDIQGKTPLDIAREQAFAEEAALLVRYGGERTPAELTAQQKYSAKLIP
jgi:ankyrin repeat protein